MRVDVPLLKHQHQFVSDFSSRYLLLVGGYGSGKTRSLVLKMLLLASKNVGCDLAILSPTNSMVRDVLEPELDRQLDELKLSYVYRASPLPSYELHFPNGKARLLLRSAENYRRLLGLNLAGFGVDELDSIPSDIAEPAWRVLMSRLRAGTVQQGCISTTPEGYKFCHQFFVKQAARDRRLIRARTADNPFLPSDYVDSLLANYPPQLVDAYLNGEFTNLTQGRVYPNFDRLLNGCNDTIGLFDRLHIGVDFNTERTCGIVHVIREGEPRAVGELVNLRDTPELIAQIKRRYAEHCLRNQVVIYPDASGGSRKSTNAAETDILLLRQAGFRVVIGSSNPRIRDRVNSMNAMFCNAQNERRYMVNIKACPNYVESLEQQTYTPHGEPDKQHDWDHPVDAAGYFIHRCFGIKPPNMRQGVARWA